MGVTFRPVTPAIEQAPTITAGQSTSPRHLESAYINHQGTLLIEPPMPRLNLYRDNFAIGGFFARIACFMGRAHENVTLSDLSSSSAARRESLLRAEKVCCAQEKSAARRKSLLRAEKVCCAQEKSAARRESLLRAGKVCCAQGKSAARRKSLLRAGSLCCGAIMSVTRGKSL